MANITGTTGDDIFDDTTPGVNGTSGSDVIRLLTGDDSTRPGDGADEIVGGPGSDLVSYLNSADGVGVDLINGGRRGWADGDTYSGIENVLGTISNDSLFGSPGANELTGEQGNDTLVGRGGNDRIFGGLGNDRVVGGPGDDFLVGGRGDDFYVVAQVADEVVEFANEGVDTVRAFLDYTLGANVERGFLGFKSGGKSSDLTGNSADNFLRGNAGSNELSGLGGADNLRGNSGNDTLDGGTGRDRLFGGGDDDIIIGGGGADVMRGQTGADTFLFRTLSDAAFSGGLRDRVVDFVSGEDNFDFSGIDANTTVAGNQAFTYIGDAAFSGTAGEFRVAVTGDGFFINADVDGVGGSDMRVFVNGTSVFDQADFIL